MEADAEVLACDLCIVGAGWEGVNVLNAASKYLPESARVVVIARERTWGGQWVDQYDFVRLHGPHLAYGIGERPWLSLAPQQKAFPYQASKREILQYFEETMEACVTERSLDVVKLFEHHFDGHSTNDGKVEISVHRMAQPSAKLRVVASRLIKALGADTPIKSPFPVPGGLSVHSLCPGDVGSPSCIAKMRFGEFRAAPIFVVGSGKTAMDVILRLSRELPGASHRIHCIAGRGTYFASREVLFPAQAPSDPDAADGIDLMIEMFDIFDGTNGLEVLNHVASKGLLRSPIPDAASFVNGTASAQEVAEMAAALSPSDQKVTKAHLLCIQQDAGQPSLLMRHLDGSTARKQLPPGTFVINCTDNFRWQPAEPVISDGGLVMSPQLIAGTAGPSGNIATHLYFQGKLEDLWRGVPRRNYDARDKANTGCQYLMTAVLNNALMASKLPEEVRISSTPPSIFSPGSPSLLRLKEAMPRLMEKLHRVVKGRYTDTQELVVPPHLGGWSADTP
ncbi:hypothetical protein EMIHUDRAFT_212130 [Emiliania huxleyi CCMP1516]|uniref:L-ornithine N(5)-oxygenase n=2 Tax=Emiliania huxleyi TaxID=2903 RepID=A0A0D3IS85_EMIH1|nr:hypothetical protein EMIHUDRAFT_212130 [Emiliania huxleyi CCMP1516]EOD14120.1 hypothetical protein EMIHUDRAFT_212130 [Emiliania huxleyi CCMP1516]|eukprot:XP_005766549.1 hypothetical protein EMIHUDRAFT_212130 [Emiliania huxleyi CCMP1516]